MVGIWTGLMPHENDPMRPEVIDPAVAIVLTPGIESARMFVLMLYVNSISAEIQPLFFSGIIRNEGMAYVRWDLLCRDCATTEPTVLDTYHELPKTHVDHVYLGIADIGGACRPHGPHNRGFTTK